MILRTIATAARAARVLVMDFMRQSGGFSGRANRTPNGMPWPSLSAHIATQCISALFSGTSP
jgi:hypothetical protein